MGRVLTRTISTRFKSGFFDDSVVSQIWRAQIRPRVKFECSNPALDESILCMQRVCLKINSFVIVRLVSLIDFYFRVGPKMLVFDLIPVWSGFNRDFGLPDPNRPRSRSSEPKSEQDLKFLDPTHHQPQLSKTSMSVMQLWTLISASKCISKPPIRRRVKSSVCWSSLGMTHEAPAAPISWQTVTNGQLYIQALHFIYVY